MHDTAGNVSHTGHRLFTRTTPRIRGSDHANHRFFSLHSNSFFSLLYFLKLSILSPALPLFFPLGIYIYFFFYQLTFLSSSPCHPSSYSLLPISWLRSSPLFFPVSLKISHLSLQYCLSTLCTYHQNFSNSCHHLSLATGEGSVCVEICRSTVCEGCVCTDRHWVNVIKGWCALQNGKGTGKRTGQALKQLWI